MKRLLPFWVLVTAFTSSLAYGDVTTPGGKVIDCYCTDKAGSRVELGQSICLFVDGRAFMARCEMSLNVPMWRDTGKGCVSASLGGDGLGYSVPSEHTPLTKTGLPL